MENLNKDIEKQNIGLSNLLEKIRAFQISSNSGKGFLNLAVENIHNAISENWAYLELNLKTTNKNPDYKKGFAVLMEYWDSLPDEEKPKIDKRLKAIGI